MPNPEHLRILEQGVGAWNAWRRSARELPAAELSQLDQLATQLADEALSEADILKHPRPRGTPITFTGAELWDANLAEQRLAGVNFTDASLVAANLSGADLRWAHFNKANLWQANLTGANLAGADFSGAILTDATFSDANLIAADLTWANLARANFSRSICRHARFTEATLVQTKLDAADLTGALVYGISAWDVSLVATIQRDLVITPESEAAKITVDDLEVAQFVYLLLKNEKIRNTIDTIGAKGVLILGRFTKERKAVLDAIRLELHKLGFVPMMFDFDNPTQRDFSETVRTLAGLSRFIVADITNPRSSPLELQALMPDYMIPFVPIIHEGEEPFAMFRDLKQKYGGWVLDVLKYDSIDNLTEVFQAAIVEPALELSRALVLKKAEAICARHVNDYRKPGAGRG